MSVSALFAFISRVQQTRFCYKSIQKGLQGQRKVNFIDKIICLILLLQTQKARIPLTNKQNYSFIRSKNYNHQRESMSEQANEVQARPANYLNGLLEKNPKASSKAQQYVVLKNVEISQRLMNGEELISPDQADIKIAKNEAENDRKRPAQVTFEIKLQTGSDREIGEKKVLVIAGQSSKQQQQTKSPPKQLTQQQRLKFVKEKIRQNKNIQKRKEEQLKKFQDKQKLQKQLQDEQKLKKQEELKKKRLQQTKLKLEEIEKRKEQRVLQNKKANQILKEKSKEKILADKIHEQYISSQNILLDQKKKKLAEIRQLYKPIDRNQLDEHMKKFEQAKLERSRNKQATKSQLNTSSQKIHQYHRSMFHNILQKDKKRKEQEEIEQTYKIKELKEKGKKYAEDVKVSFKPEIDPKKRQQIENRIKSSSLIGTKDIDKKIKGIEYLEFTKQYAQKFKKQIEGPPENQVLMRKEANKTQHPDYLEEFRKKNQDSRLKRSATSAEDFIKKVEKKNLSHWEKQQSIIQFAEDLERKARAKQKITKIGYAEKIDQEVDKLYISAIEAKIKALQV